MIPVALCGILALVTQTRLHTQIALGPTVAGPAGTVMAQVPPGRFEMGAIAGGWDAKPTHPVTISNGFLFGTRPVTNAEYERFDPSHRSYRGRQGTSTAEDAPVRFVTWNEAQAYCRWLAIQEGKPYRLPTEAEWEYVAKTFPSSFADNGESENWCLDWYGPYPAEAQTDPLGYASGDFRVVRGGEAVNGSALAAYRLSDLPDDRNAFVGFRVVQAPAPAGAPLQTRPLRQWQTGVAETPAAWVPPVASNVPYFATPIEYVRIPPHSHGPLFSRHNHVPGIAYCDNGDLMAVWYSTETEPGRELVVASSRLRRGQTRWDEADLFWDVAGRNDHAPAIWNDGAGTLYHFNGLSAGAGWRDLATIMRTSTDNGATWSPARFIAANHEHGNMPISGVFRRQDGAICLPCDADPGPEGGTILHISEDGGQSWYRSDEGMPAPVFAAGSTGSRIAGIHASIAALADGSLVAVGRGNDIDGRMPMSVSYNGGLTWTYSATPFPPLSMGQRPVLRQLQEGPLLLISFTPGSFFRDAQGDLFEGHGMFAALSYDGGSTWPIEKLLTDGTRRTLNGQGWTHEFTMGATSAEPMGYLTAVQTPDGIVNLVSSGVHYRFNYAWLLTPNRKP